MREIKIPARSNNATRKAENIKIWGDKGLKRDEISAVLWRCSLSIGVMTSYDAPIVWRAQSCTIFDTATDRLSIFNLQSSPSKKGSNIYRSTKKLYSWHNSYHSQRVIRGFGLRRVNFGLKLQFASGRPKKLRFMVRGSWRFWRGRKLEAQCIVKHYTLGLMYLDTKSLSNPEYNSNVRNLKLNKNRVTR